MPVDTTHDISNGHVILIITYQGMVITHLLKSVGTYST